MATKKITFDDWRDAAKLYNNQFEYSRAQVAKYEYLLSTQNEPGNLPVSLLKWRSMVLEMKRLCVQHWRRGQRLKLVAPDVKTVVYFPNINPVCFL